MNRFVTHLESAIDGTSLPANQLQTMHQDRPLWVRYDLDAVRRAVSKPMLRDRPPTMWRFRELLPLENFEIIVWPRIGRVNLSLRFFFVRSDELVAIGDHEICLKAAGRLVALPSPIVAFVAAYDPH